MTTPRDIITAALKKAGILGIGQTALAEDINDGFTDLTDMMAQWQRKRWLVWHLVDSAKVSTGATSYTVGPGGDFNIARRPDRLESAFFRQVYGSTPPYQIDYPLELIEARETYNTIALKQLTAFPSYVFYDSAYPTATLYPWPLPQSGIYEIHITYKDLLQQFTSLSEDITLPPEYFAALKFNLARRFRQAYQLPPQPELNALATDALNVIRQANAQIPQLQIDPALIRPGIYDVFSDTTY